MTSEMSLYFMILSAEVVDVSDGEAFTFTVFIHRNVNSTDSALAFTQQHENITRFVPARVTRWRSD